jgi:hypothetical protein
METSIEELLLLPTHTLRRVRGTKNIEKAHKALEKQLKGLTITGDPIGRSEVIYSNRPEGKEEGENRRHQGSIPEDRDDKEKQRIQRATTLVHEGHTRRAVRCLLSEGVPSISEKTRSDLRKLHPQGPLVLPICPQDAPRMLVADKEKIKEIVLKELANGAAPGRSGWTGDLLKALVYDDECLEGLVALVVAIANGDIGGKVKRLLLSSLLIGLPKPNGGTRPIAMGEIFYKLSGAYMLHLD